MIHPNNCATATRVAVIRQPRRYGDAVVRDSLRRMMRPLGLSWQQLVRPGERVLLKPDFIRESHTNRPNKWEQIVTHGSVIAAVGFEVAFALSGRGMITISDQMEALYGQIVHEKGKTPVNWKEH